MKPAISIDGVTKGFKKHHRRRHFLTLKSTFVRDFWQKEDLDKDYFWALKDVDLDVEPGETLGLIGSNGSGKSTLLKLIAGILKPTKGQISVNGRLSALIELGAGFHPEISGRENVYINGIMLGLTKHEIHDKFDEIVNFAELWEFIDNPVRTYSSGMFMRLGFSVAVHVNPDVLLIDEVLAVGDQSFVHKCLERIFDFKRRKKTIVVVSHDMGAIDKLCSRVAWLSNGNLVEAGPARETIDAYLLSVAKKEEERYASQHQQITDSLDQLSGSASDSSDQGQTEQNNQRQPNRWGTRDVEMTQVTVLDNERKERYVYRSGESLTVRIEYSARKKIKHPVFGVAFYLQDGTWCFGSNTKLERKRIESIEGTGWIEIRFKDMNFVENTYLMSTAVHSEDETPYDYHNKLYKIAFRSEIKDIGIFRLPHEWIFNPKLTIMDD